MNIRPATPADTPAIVGLLKVSLGEALTEKSEVYWKWKHEANPFGKSPVWLAEEGSNLVGVRAFMSWRWTDGVSEFKALRAVDTATHPAFMGRGIFSRLTSALVESCREEGYDFIFNTPNEKSRPGYLKLGWKQAGRLSVVVMPGLEFFLPREAKALDDHPPAKWFDDPHLDEFLQSLRQEKIHTPVSAEYLRWRYQHVPVTRYGVIGELSGPGKFLLIFRVKEGKWFRELRLADVFALPGARQGVMTAIKELQHKFRPHLVTCSEASRTFLTASLRLKGPIVTTRVLNRPLDINHWSPSLGDMELF